ncbi:Heparanase-like protein [Thalictrum thalictroides]|uniref:Heparanase-like protein n=1 Tax=Thalictrum thalictroides TaxID=46969 RepID=A0A7J6WNX5_THATH|nr:Heparanase-like protein [Thalictrum thalictroides]
MGFLLPLFLFVAYLYGVSAQGPSTYATIIVKSAAKIAETDDQFICATLDWWPSDKCNYNDCPWGNSTVPYLDLSHPILAKAIQAFDHLRIRIGGSLQDHVVYDVGTLKYPCHPFKKIDEEIFKFSEGCLHMNRWDELNHLFNKTGAIVTFGLNALYGRHKIKGLAWGGGSAWGGAWDSSNAHEFINYTVSKGYHIDSWELGNELSEPGIGASVGAEQYGKDMIELNVIINEIYKNSHSRPLILAPGGFFNASWYAKLLEVSGSNVVNVLTHHLYNLGPGNDTRLVNKILDPHYLSNGTFSTYISNGTSDTFKKLQQTIKNHGPWASAWVGESGGAYNSGGRDVSNTFVYSFWYLDILGMASKYNTKVYCRQTLIGGNYGLLNRTTFVPNPDYYSALLWHRLMGKGVLDVDSKASAHLRVYAHCSKSRAGITVLLINLSRKTSFKILVQNDMNINLHVKEKNHKGGHKGRSLADFVNKSVPLIERKASDVTAQKEEYHLSPDGHLRSQRMLLNGKPLQLTKAGDIPTLDPVFSDVTSPISIAPLSIAFIVLPQFVAPACV